jgi:hypothetical protein
LSVREVSKQLQLMEFIHHHTSYLQSHKPISDTMGGKAPSWKDLGIHLWSIIFSYSLTSITDIHDYRLLGKKLLSGDDSGKLLQLLARRSMRRLLCNEFGLLFDDLIEVLGQTKSVISGNFLLQSLLGVEKTFDKDSDIDIYAEFATESDPMRLDGSPMDVIRSFLVDNNYILLYSTVFQGFNAHQIDPLDPTDLVFNPEGYGEFSSVYVSMIKTFESNIENSLGQRKKIQIIEMKSGLKPSQVYNYFDLTICQVILQCIPTIIDRVSDDYQNEDNDAVRGFLPYFLVKHLQDILSRTLRINPNIKEIFAQMEAEDPVNGVLTQHDKVKLLEKLEGRIKKYESRGFNIPETVGNTSIIVDSL